MSFLFGPETYVCEILWKRLIAISVYYRTAFDAIYFVDVREQNKKLIDPSKRHLKRHYSSNNIILLICEEIILYVMV